MWHVKKSSFVPNLIEFKSNFLILGSNYRSLVDSENLLLKKANLRILGFVLITNNLG